MKDIPDSVDDVVLFETRWVMQRCDNKGDWHDFLIHAEASTAVSSLNRERHLSPSGKYRIIRRKTIDVLWQD